MFFKNGNDLLLQKIINALPLQNFPVMFLKAQIVFQNDNVLRLQIFFKNGNVYLYKGKSVRNPCSKIEKTKRVLPFHFS